MSELDTLEEFLEFENSVISNFSRYIPLSDRVMDRIRVFARDLREVNESLDLPIEKKRMYDLVLQAVEEVAGVFDIEALELALEKYKRLRDIWSEEFFPAFDTRTLISGLIHYLHTFALDALSYAKKRKEGQFERLGRDIQHILVETYSAIEDWVYLTDRGYASAVVDEVDERLIAYIRLGSSAEHVSRIVVEPIENGFFIKVIYFDEDNSVKNRLSVEMEEIGFTEDEDTGDRISFSMSLYEGADRLEEIVEKVIEALVGCISADFRIKFRNRMSELEELLRGGSVDLAEVIAYWNESYPPPHPEAQEVAELISEAFEEAQMASDAGDLDELTHSLTRAYLLIRRLKNLVPEIALPE